MLRQAGAGHRVSLTISLWVPKCIHPENARFHYNHFFLFYLHLFIPWLSPTLKTGCWKSWPSGWQLSQLRDLRVPCVCEVQISENYTVQQSLWMCSILFDSHWIMKMNNKIAFWNLSVRVFFILLPHGQLAFFVVSPIQIYLQADEL